MELVGLSVVGTVPALFWLWWFYRQDRLDPEPRGLVFKLFLLGMLPVIPAGLLELALLRLVPGLSGGGLLALMLGQLFVIAPIEEYGKFLVVKRWAASHPAFDEPLDGIIYAAAAALGFAALENALYMIGHGGWVIVVRGPVSTLAHVLFSAFWGYALGMARLQTDPAAADDLIRGGLRYAILGHATFNLFLTANQVHEALVLLVLLVPALLVLLYRRVARQIATSKANSPFQLRARVK